MNKRGSQHECRDVAWWRSNWLSFCSSLRTVISLGSFEGRRGGRVGYQFGTVQLIKSKGLSDRNPLLKAVPNWSGRLVLSQGPSCHSWFSPLLPRIAAHTSLRCRTPCWQQWQPLCDCFFSRENHHNLWMQIGCTLFSQHEKRWQLTRLPIWVCISNEPIGVVQVCRI